MANASYFGSEDTLLEKTPTIPGIYYAVYDSCVTNHVPSHDLAFIEQRSSVAPKDTSSGEIYFHTLGEAKVYVKAHFTSGGEYFSIKQAQNPDDFLQIIMDKVNYLIA